MFFINKIENKSNIIFRLIKGIFRRFLEIFRIDISENVYSITDKLFPNLPNHRMKLSGFVIEIENIDIYIVSSEMNFISNIYGLRYLMYFYFWTTATIIIMILTIWFFSSYYIIKFIIMLNLCDFRKRK